MKVRKQTAIIITLISAIAVYILRRMELKYALDGVYMVINTGEIHSLILRIFTVAACIAVSVVLFLSRDKLAPAAEFEIVFSLRTKVLFVVSGVMLLTGAVLQLRWSQNYYYEVRWLQMLFIYSVIAFGVITVFSPFADKALCFRAMCVGALCVSMWMLYSYRYNANNPSLCYYIYETLSVLFMALACYYFAGFGFGIKKPRLVILFSSFGAILAAASLADKTQLKDILIYSALLPLSFGLIETICEIEPDRNDYPSSDSVDGENADITIETLDKTTNHNSDV